MGDYRARVERHPTATHGAERARTRKAARRIRGAGHGNTHTGYARAGRGARTDGTAADGTAAHAAEPLCSLDIDGNGEATALTDGLLLIRHLFGFTGTTLTDGALGSGCSRCTGAEITAHLDTPACQALFDADGDGARTALTDGLLVIRHLFGFSGSTLTDGALGDGAVRDTAEAIAAWLDARRAAPGEAPRRVQLVGATSVQGDRIDLEWLATVDNDTPPEEIRYRLHAGSAPDFVPDAATLQHRSHRRRAGQPHRAHPRHPLLPQGRGRRRRRPQQLEQRPQRPHRRRRPDREQRPAPDPRCRRPTSAVTDDSVQYQLPPGGLPPAPGDLIVSAEGDGLLRRATSVDSSGGQVTIQTAPAALAEAFDTLEFATEIKLIDLPASASQAATAYDPSSGAPPTDTRRVTWPERGLTLIDSRPAPSAPMAAAASDPIDCDGLGGVLRSNFDGPLQVRYPEAACVEPGSLLDIDVEALIDAASWRGTSRSPSSASRASTTPRSTMRATTTTAPAGPRAAVTPPPESGRLLWVPGDYHVDDSCALTRRASRAKAGHALAPVFRERRCNKTVNVEVKIAVTWGNLPGPTQQGFSGANAKLSISGEAGIDFQPTVRAEVDISALGGLDYAELAVTGPISFDSTVTLSASANATYQDTKQLFDKRFLKVFSAGPVPIVISGRLRLNLEFRGEVDAALDITKLLEMGYDIYAGVQYTDADGWQVLQEASPWQRFELHGEADTRAYVELRFVPDLEVAFYEVATGRLIVEPYLYGEAALEGHFLYRVLADGSGVEEGSDADYRFTKLEFGGGMDAKFRAGLEALDVSIIGYPSKDPEDFVEFALIDKTPIIGLPSLAPVTTDTVNLEDPCGIGVSAEITDVPNPFRDLFGGPETFNAFAPESAAWQVVLPSGGEVLTPGAQPADAWFSAAAAGTYTLRFSGHSALGSFIRQYEEVVVDYSIPDGCTPPTTATVDATDNLYGAGQASNPGGGTDPVVVALPAGKNRVVTFPSVSGSWSWGSSWNGPDGIAESRVYTSPNTLSGLTLGRNRSLLGIFLTDTVPGIQPPALDFTLIGSDFTELRPEVGQVFFIGDGLTGTGDGDTQKFLVPDEATRLFLGVADNSTPGAPIGAFWDNQGAMSLSIEFSTDQPEPPANGLVAYYPLDGNASEASGHPSGPHNGTAFGGVAYESGVSGQAASFDGVNDYIELPSALTLFGGAEPDGWTVAGYFKLEETSGSNWTIFSDYDARDDDNVRDEEYGMFVIIRDRDGNRRLRGSVRYSHFGGGYSVVDTESVPWGEWVSFAFVTSKADGEIRLYIDGELRATTDIADQSYLDSSRVFIGADYYDGGMTHFAKGLIDEVRIYNRPLSAGELAALAGDLERAGSSLVW